MTRALDGDRKFALMARAGADFAAWANLAAVGQVAAQLFAVLVINDFIFVFAVDAKAALWRSETPLSVASTLTAVAAAVGTGPARSAGAATARTGTAARLIFHNFIKCSLVFRQCAVSVLANLSRENLAWRCIQPFRQARASNRLIAKFFGCNLNGRFVQTGRADVAQGGIHGAAFVRTSFAVENIDIAGDDFGAIMFLPVFAFPLASFEASLDIDH